MTIKELIEKRAKGIFILIIKIPKHITYYNIVLKRIMSTNMLSFLSVVTESLISS